MAHEGRSGSCLNHFPGGPPSPKEEKEEGGHLVRGCGSCFGSGLKP